eukprot:TRINITY_DN342_c0_g1_i1.p1 TRINITY_DN342_c0_g1~~TRINITY_DN342_c0_g1_i1.p1  ORF type:complete len:336 (-),score=95.56 TRINITY_DN342_c0_g1_i1:164-1171(-)
MANVNDDGASIEPLADGISGLRWSPTANLLAATCWDGNAYIWDVQRADAAQAKAAKSIGGPALCSAWSADGQMLFVGGCTARPQAWDLNSDQMVDIAVHDQPTRCIIQVPGQENLICTGSWDGTIRYWDFRAATGEPALSLNMGERVYCMDAVGELLVVALANRKVVIYNLKNPDKEFGAKDSPLKYQSRALSCFPDQSGFALGSIEGRVAIHYIQENASIGHKNFAFKCHRKGHASNDVYPVSDIHFNSFGTFATAGSDGTAHFWDKDSRQRLRAFKDCGQSISACRFSATSELFAYAVSYDWHKGASGYKTTEGNRIFIHAVTEKEITPRKGK